MENSKLAVKKGREKNQVVVTPETLKPGKSLNTTHKSEIILCVLRRVHRMLNKVFLPFIVLTQNQEQLGRQLSFWSDLHSDLSQDIKLIWVQIHWDQVLRHVWMKYISSFPLPESVDNQMLRQKLLAKDTLKCSLTWQQGSSLFFSNYSPLKNLHILSKILMKGYFSSCYLYFCQYFFLLPPLFLPVWLF